MKNICLKSLLAIFAFSMFLSCSKNDSVSSSLTGKWYYHTYKNEDNFEDNTYEFLPGNVFSATLKGSSWDGEIFHPIAFWNNIYVGTYAIQNGMLILQSQTYIDGDNGKTYSSNDKFSYTIITASPETLIVFNQEKNREEIWKKGSYN